MTKRAGHQGSTVKYGEVKVEKFPFVGCGEALAASKQNGTEETISDAEYGGVFGVHILEPRATELTHPSFSCLTA